MRLLITVDGIPRTVILQSISITKDLNGRSSQCSFDMALEPSQPSTFPSMESEIIIYNALEE